MIIQSSQLTLGLPLGDIVRCGLSGERQALEQAFWADGHDTGDCFCPRQAFAVLVVALAYLAALEGLRHVVNRKGDHYVALWLVGVALWLVLAPVPASITESSEALFTVTVAALGAVLAGWTIVRAGHLLDGRQ